MHTYVQFSARVNKILYRLAYSNTVPLFYSLKQLIKLILFQQLLNHVLWPVAVIFTAKVSSEFGIR